MYYVNFLGRLAADNDPSQTFRPIPKLFDNRPSASATEVFCENNRPGHIYSKSGLW